MKKVKLADICSINMGQSPASSSYNTERRGIPFFQGNADFGDLNPCVRLWCDAPTKIAHCGELLLSVRAPIGALNIADCTCCIGRGLAALTAKQNVCNPSWLYFALKSKISELQAQGTGSTFKAINKAALQNLLLPSQSLVEQQNIASVLQKICHLISARQQQLSKLDQLAKSRFIEMFGDPVTNPKRWEKISLSNICNIGSSKRIFEREYVSHGIPFYRTKELVERAAGKKIATELFISIERFNEIKAKYGTPQKNDLLISAVGTIGIIWIVDETQFYFKDGNILRIEASENFNSIFLKFVLEQLIREYKKQMSAGTAYAALTIVNLKKMEIFDIPLELQNKFAAFIEQLDKSKLADQTYGVAA